MNSKSFIFYTDSDDDDILFIPFQSDSDDDDMLFLPSILRNEDEEIRTWILDLFYEIIYKI